MHGTNSSIESAATTASSLAPAAVRAPRAAMARKMFSGVELFFASEFV